MARTEKFSPEGERARRDYMLERYGKGLALAFASAALTVGAVVSGYEALNSAGQSDIGNNENVYQADNREQDGARNFSADFNNFINNVDAEALGFTALSGVFLIGAFGAGVKSKEFIERGNAHFRREHNYG